MSSSTLIKKDSSDVALQSMAYDYEAKIAALTPAKREELKQLTTCIDLHDITSIQQYGAELSHQVARNGDSLLQSVRADNTAEVVQLTNDLLSELNLIDIDEMNVNTSWKRFWRNVPIVNRFVKSIQTVMIKYDTIAENVDKISKKIGSAKIIALRDNSTLQNIFDNNTEYIKQIRSLIMAAKIKVEEINDEIERMKTNPGEVETYEIQDAISFKTALEKRITDMEITENVLTQNLYQIRATQGNNMAIADKSDNIVNNIIPIWKNQLAISIVMNNQKSSIEAQKKITDTTNDILKKNAANLKMNSINVAKANEESVISLDTLRTTTQSLIETITEVKNIHAEGAKNREAVEESLKEFAIQLDNAISSLT